MSEKDITNYFNEMLAKLEMILYHEVALSAVKKVDFVGTDFLQTKKIEGNTVNEVIESCIKELTTSGIVKDVKYSIHGFGILLKLEVEGCIHMSKEVKLKEDGLKPYMCPIANMIGDRIIEIVKYETTYMADLEIDTYKEKCVVKYAIFENIDKIGKVSDWTKI